MEENKALEQQGNETQETATQEQAQETVVTPVDDDMIAKNKELTAKLAEIEAKYQKMKVQNDKMSRAEAEYKRQAREGMSATERELEILKDEVEALKEANSALSEYKNINEAKSRFVTMLGMEEEMAQKAAEADLHGDKDTVTEIIRQHNAAEKKKIEAEYKMSRSPISSGEFSGMTKSEILAIPDRAARRRAIAENQELFK